MIIALDIHQVIGRRELDFEDSYRDDYVGAVATDPHARLLWFGWLPHGAGQGYEAVTVTGFDDIEAWDRLVERTRYGDLAEWATEIDAMRYHSVTTVSVTAPWSPLDSLKLADVPVGRHAADIKAPVLILSGGKDSLFPAEHHAALTTAFPGARAKIYPAGGHNFTWEQPVEVAADIAAFLDSKDR